MYTAKQLPNGNYQVFQNGQLISTGGAGILLSYGLTPTSSGVAPAQTQTQTSTSTNNGSTGSSSTAAPTITKQLDPGTSDPQVLALQKFLNANGYPVAQSGPGSAGNETSYFGPATQAALQKYQAANGIVSSGDPQSTGYGRLGPTTLSSIQNYTPPQNQNNGGGVSLPSTGDSNLDQVQKTLSDNLSTIATGYQLDPNLDPAQHPEIIKQFLDWAHQVVDPQTQQLITDNVANINADLANQAAQYGYSRDDIVQNFGTNLANEEESAGGAGTAFSGQRNIDENNMVASTNRSLASLGATTAYNLGNSLRAGAATVGSANTGQFNLPTLAGETVSNTGGQRGSSTTTDPLAVNYDPNAYTVSTIGNQAAQNVNTQQADYLKQYSDLVANNSNSGRSVSDLLGLISGKPAGASTTLT